MKLFNELGWGLESFGDNQREENIQKVAWRLVRSAADRMGDQKGPAKLLWAVERLKKEFDLGEEAEDYIRAAYTHFKLERGV